MSAASSKPRTSCIISLEGISGCGKTFLLGELKKRLASADHCFVSELSDRMETDLDKAILAILTRTGDNFFRSGYPCTETGLIVALKTFDYEGIIRGALERGSTVWEDRSVDSIAVYQAILLNPGCSDKWLGSATDLFQHSSFLRPPPDITFLIKDDFETCISRAQERSGTTYKEDEIALLRAANTFYDEYSASMKGRVKVLDRRVLTNEELLGRMIEHHFNTMHFPGRF